MNTVRPAVGSPTRAALGAGIALVALNRAALAVGAWRRVDGWRRAAGLVLRGEAASFVLSAFALDVWSDEPAKRHEAIAAAIGDPDVAPGIDPTREHLRARLAAFLQCERAPHVRIRHGEAEDHAEASGGAGYTLRFEAAIDGPGRFVPPTRWRDDESGWASGDSSPLLNLVCRIGRDGRADVWARVNHVGCDGVPAQAMMTLLEDAWGAEAVLYPAPESFASFEGVRACPGRPEFGQVQAFVDFGPLLEWRRQRNAELREPMTLAAALLWRLAAQPEFAGIHMGTTVDTPPIGGQPGGVGVVVVRPSGFAARANGLARYVRAFNRRLELSRRREGAGWRTLDAAALVRADLAGPLLRHALANQPGAFGTLGLTMLKDARVFGTPIGDAGHADGFIAIGSVALPSADGRRVGCVTIKGESRRIAAYPAIIRRAIGEPARHGPGATC